MFVSIRVALVSLLVLLIGCGGQGDSQSGSAGSGSQSTAVPSRFQEWTGSPEAVVRGIMHAYATRDDVLYGALLSDEFVYQFEPPGADSTEILSWGRDEEVLATASLFQTAELERVSLTLNLGEATQRSARGVMIPVQGGELRLEVREKEPTVVTLNRQEIFLEPRGSDAKEWHVVAWHDYPAPQ